MILCLFCSTKATKDALLNRTALMMKALIYGLEMNDTHSEITVCPSHLCCWSAVNKAYNWSIHRVAYMPELQHTQKIWHNIFCTNSNSTTPWLFKGVWGWSAVNSHAGGQGSDLNEDNENTLQIPGVHAKTLIVYCLDNASGYRHHFNTTCKWGYSDTCVAPPPRTSRVQTHLLVVP